MLVIHYIHWEFNVTYKDIALDELNGILKGLPITSPCVYMVSDPVNAGLDYDYGDYDIHICQCFNLKCIDREESFNYKTPQKWIHFRSRYGIQLYS